MTSKQWMITGASSGLGEALAKAALERGDAVVATFRQADQAAAFCALAPARACGIVMDVTDLGSVAAGVDEAVKELGGHIDVVVNNAGYALAGLIEQISDAEAEQQLQTNVLGALRVCRATLPIFRRQKSGRYLNIASLAGSIGFPGLSLYSASKFALIGFTEALSAECASFGAFATSVEPGGFRTNFGTSSMVAAAAPAPEDGYDRLLTALAGGRENMAVALKGDPAKAALRLLALADMDHPPVRFALGDDALAMILPALDRRLAEYNKHATLGQGTSL